MALSTKLKDESSRFISSLLLSALEGCQQGNMELAERLGLSIETMQKLDRLRADQIFNISGNYVRDLSALEVFQIDSSKISRIIELAAEETRQYEMIDEFLRRGACKTMMAELFGMRSTQVASRKKFLNLPTVKGRLPVSTLEEQRQIYDAWLDSLKIADYRERLLYVARATNLSMSKIYREVQEIEEITNKSTQLKKTKICA
ncbi:STY4526/YPO1902 family pathogenicity island replication protein [Dasania sp. GY-19]|uniref:STY4526/YPO1902 family pathogenicity island replication protein n=1 Tax=Dasania phycosphaerae TaxID=2950436 RepID=A0A9J6RQH4_9GAMM|nr:STY4526/YPO1902 family pathogenicity island replication protein [Dasania phycosphaerae]MCZ0866545.1 STY4526/YPO1902 family pathogenicity island replication protein [Dasania phycosphaerae]